MKLEIRLLVDPPSGDGITSATDGPGPAESGVRRICRALEGQVAIAVVGFSAEPAVLRDPASVCQFLVGLADVISALAGGREAAWSLPESPCEFRLTTRGEWLWARVMPGSEGACRSAMFGKRDFEPRPTYGGG